MSKHLGTTIPITIRVIDSNGVPQTGKTVDLYVQRIIDGYYWTGSDWQSSSYTLSFSEVGATALYVYNLDTSIANFGTPDIAVISPFVASDNWGVEFYMNFTLDEDYYLRSIIEPKLPTHYIIGSSDADDHDTDIDGIKTVTDNIPDSGAMTSISDETDKIQSIKTVTDRIFDNAIGAITDGSFADELMNKDSGQTFSSATDSLEAIRDRGDAAWAGTGATKEEIADAVWDEALSGHVVAGSSGKSLADIESDVTEIPSETNSKTFNSTALASVNAEVDTALNTAIPGSPTVDSINERVKAIDDKLPSSTYLKGTADADGGMDTADKADVNAQADLALTDYDPPTRTEATSDKNEIIAEVDANETKIDNLDSDLVTHDTDVKALIGTPVADVSTDIATNLTAITSIQNNTRFTSAIPEQMQKPDSSSRAFRWTGNLYDTDGNMEDPTNNEILIRVLQADGTAITANLYKEQALTNPLDNATDQVNFPSGDGWRAMERLGTGKYDLFYKVASTETEESLTVEFGWYETGVIMSQYRATEVVDYAGDIEDIQAKVDVLYAKRPANYFMGSSVDTDKDDEIDAILEDTGTTIPEQITTHDTDIKGLVDIKATPEFLVVPSGVSRINVEGGITAVQTSIPVYDSTQFESEGIVYIGTELVSYTGISSGSLTGCTRGYNGTTPATHADSAAVYEVVSYPLRLMVFDKENNMTAPDSAPTIEIVDWAGTQEIAPTAMTLISTGLYGYDYLVYQTDAPEAKTLRFSIVISGVTTLRQSTLMMLDRPASTTDMITLVGGGNGDYAVDQDGWYDSNGIQTLWTDVMAGYLRDATSGSRLDDVLVTAYEVINGTTVRAIIPPGQTVCDGNGNYEMRLDAGTYVFKFYKDQYRFPTDEVTRVIS